ncbi:diacylglycerol/lipid kinase family protein [Chondromyces crocatus]|uniref:Diacylglycerol kinase n=1 Tax=Chondromyces crocatus TaxID=52 RepID=A0A0K1E5K0_CHOCO|nr:diacylglycerol kinase family protein [Chondromyces crocatus]AKT36151.1 diacylglycerol kinase [Chondromyces crocatus]
MRPLIIVNPRSAGGKTGQLFDGITGTIRRALGDFDVQRTERPRHAVELARVAAQEGRELVVAVGGDGCIHEVVNGLMQARDGGALRTRLGLIGQGTGGDFRRTLGLEHRLEHYCAALRQGRPRLIDIGQFSYRDHEGRPAEAYFVNILSAGLGGLVDKHVARIPKVAGGALAYFAASARGLIESRIGRLRCRLMLNGEGRELEMETRQLTICNGRVFGGGMKVAPMAELDDGLLEVVDLGAASLPRFIAVSMGVYSARHLRHPDVKHHRCERIEIELLNKDAEERFLLDVDGEPLGRLPVSVSVIPRALEVMGPP